MVSNGASTSQSEIRFLYLSELLEVPVRYEGDPSPCGRLSDIGVHKTSLFPVVTRLEVKSRAQGAVTLAWPSVREISSREILVRRETSAPAPCDFWLRRDVLDDQVVDVSGAKVRRVNDIQLLSAEGKCVIAHVEVGVLGILRRLGFQKPVCALVHWLFDYTIKDLLIPWREVEVISPGGVQAGVRVAKLPSRFADFHPAEMADILEDLGAEERRMLFNGMDVETAAETLEEVAPDVQRTLITQEDPAKAADILEEMPIKEAADVLRDMHDGDAEKIISRMESDAAADVRTLLAHEEDTAGGSMSTSCIEVTPGHSAAAVIEHIRTVAGDIEVLNTVYVVDQDHHLVGVLSLRELLCAPSDATVENLMTTHLITVSSQTGVRDLGRLFAKYGFRSLPVVDDGGILLGAIRMKDVLDELAPLIKE